MISVILPLYNKEHTIIRTLNTVINQTFKKFEVLIVNDGSTDLSIDLINKYFCDHRIKIITQNNQGVSAARNNGVKYASYDWITFIDGDDEWMPNYLESVRKIINTFPNANMIGCASYYKDMMTGEVYAMPINKYVDKTLSLDYLMCPDKMQHIGGTCIRKSIFEKIGGFPVEIKINEDFSLMYRAALLGNFVYCGTPLHIYCGNVQNQTTSVFNNYSERINSFAIVYSEIADMWITLGKKNKNLRHTLQYKLSGIFINGLKKQDYETLNLFCNNISPGLKYLIGSTELKFINVKGLRYVLLISFYIKKARWILKGFPRVGEKITHNEELVNRYHNAMKNFIKED